MRPERFRQLCLARDLLAEIREDSPSIGDVARLARISPFHFIRQFEALFGLTPHQFRIQRPLELTIAVFSDTCGNLIQIYQPA